MIGKPPISSSADLTAFLRKSGQTVDDLKWRTLINVLTNKIQLQVQHDAQKVTNAQIAAYYNQNRTQFTTPETRDVNIPGNVEEVVSHVKKVRSQGTGVISMKLVGEGSFTSAEDRQAAPMRTIQSERKSRFLSRRPL